VLGVFGFFCHLIIKLLQGTSVKYFYHTIILTIYFEKIFIFLSPRENSLKKALPVVLSN
jgi:hypothetical protein